MFYFTCNESRIYEIYMKIFHDILVFWDAPVFAGKVGCTKYKNQVVEICYIVHNS